MSLEVLENIGLTKGEIKVYEALLELGESTKTPIANRSEISPGKVYDVLERLMKKGLVSIIKKGNVKHFKVGNPKNLQNFVKKKKEELINEEQIVSNILPTLLAKFTEKKTETDAEVYKGWKGLQTIYDGIVEDLKQGDTDYVLGATKGLDPKRTIQFFKRFNRRRYEKDIKLKIIYNKADKEFAKKYINNKKLDQLRFLDLQTPAEINVFGEKVVIAILTETPIGILISSKEAAESFKQYFDKIWKIAK